LGYVHAQHHPTLLQPPPRVVRVHQGAFPAVSAPFFFSHAAPFRPPSCGSFRGIPWMHPEIRRPRVRRAFVITALPLATAFSVTTIPRLAPSRVTTILRLAPSRPPTAQPRCHNTNIIMGDYGPAALYGFARDRAAGLAVAGTIGFAAEKIAPLAPISLSPLLYATAIGIGIGNTLRLVDPEMKAMATTEIGMSFAKRRLLRAGIILYGAKITFAKILAIGLPGLLTDLYVVISTLLIGFKLGKFLGLSEGLVTLISTGSAICGCSAVAATQPIINAEAHEVAAAVGVVVLCGTLAMFIYPALYTAVPALMANPGLMGIYTGATVHELAGVVAAGNTMGADVASTSVITKLLRVFLLEPWIIALYYLGIGQKKDATAATGMKKGKGVPWFAFGFIAVATINSIWGIAPSLQKLFTTLSAGFLASAMAALGLDTDLVKVKSLGWKPIALAMALWANLLGMGFVVARFLFETL
jgi:uncharacterized integral membrane protein (TIGR00698 family)